MKNQLLLFAGFVSFLSMHCAGPSETSKPVDLNQLRTEIQAMEDAYSAAEKVKDAAAVAAYYSDDAISHNRGEEPTVGKAAIQERLQSRMAEDTSGNYNVYKVVDLFADGNMPVEIGSWTEYLPSGEVKGKGHYMSYFEKRNGKYVCVRDMNTSIMPEKKEADPAATQ